MAEQPEKTASRKPADTAFKQQRLKAWQPILTASTALPVFFIVGIVFIPIGAILLVASDGVQEKDIEYTHCNSTTTGGGCDDFFKNVNNSGKTCKCSITFSLSTKFSGEVFLYYGLSNFYQNHRRYVRSRDDLQLNGNLKSTVNKDCAPFDKNSNSTPVAPCGAIANSLFNDTFELSYIKSKNSAPIKVNLTYKDIAWESDRTVKFKNPSGNLKNAFSKFAKPRDWQRPVYELSTDPKNNGFINQDFIVWMRTAAFSTFRKLYRKIVKEGTFDEGLPKGDYRLDISYNYPVVHFDGQKRVILSTTSWIGGKNPFLGIAYITVGILCLVLGICFFIIHIKFGKRGYSSADGLPLQDMSS